MTSLNKKWIPKSVLCLQAGYTRRDLISDLIAGLTVGLVALPLAMAFGIASGVTPQAGLYTAVVAGFLISALGGSRLQIGGPTGAFVVIVAGIIATHGVSGLLIVTLMAGVILMLMARDRFGYGGEIYSSTSHYWLHEWHCRTDRFDTDQGLSGS